jgi:hypothetical protein
MKLHMKGKGHNLKNKSISTNVWNSEQWFESRFISKTVLIAGYNILAIPSLLYGCEIWKLNQRDINRLKTVEMVFMRCTAGYSLLDH